MEAVWTKIVAESEVTVDQPFPFILEGKHLAVFRVAEDIVIIDNVCTHSFALLTDGYIDNGCVECPLHQGLFDIRTGRAMSEPVYIDLNVHPAKIEDGWVLINFVRAEASP